MNYHGRLKLDEKRDIVPALFQRVVRCWTSAAVAVSGADVTLLTSTHLIELKNDVIKRNCRLPESSKRPTSIDVLQSSRGWFYVVSMDDSLLLLAGNDLTECKRFNGISSYRIGDYIKLMKPLLYVDFRTSDPILTDGVVNFNMNQVLMAEPGEQNVDRVLNRKLNITRRALDRNRMELETTKTFVEDTLRSLAASFAHIPTVQEDRLQSMVGQPSSEGIPQQSEPDLKITHHEVRALGGNVVVILHLFTNKLVENLSIQTVLESQPTACVKTACILLRPEGLYLSPKLVTRLRPDEKGFGVLILPQSVLAFGQSYSCRLFVSVHYHQGRSYSKSIELDCSNVITKQPRLNSDKEDYFLHDFLAFFYCGVRENVQIVSQLGCLTDIFIVLHKLGFEKSDKFGLFVRKTGNYFYGVFVMHTFVSSQDVRCEMYAPTYTVLACLVKVLRTKMPCDATVNLVSSSKS